jgi:hypothetical protein
VRLLSAAALLLCAGVTVLAQPRTTISLDVLSDGTCSIAVHGAGGRSEISYLPRTPGRCAIPSIRNPGPVALEVRLAPGASIPATSVPDLRWSLVDGRPRGVAELAAAPEFVDVMPAGRNSGRMMAAILFAAALAAAVWALVHDWLQRSRA